MGRLTADIVRSKLRSMKEGAEIANARLFWRAQCTMEDRKYQDQFDLSAAVTKQQQDPLNFNESLLIGHQRLAPTMDRRLAFSGRDQIEFRPSSREVGKHVIYPPPSQIGAVMVDKIITKESRNRNRQGLRSTSKSEMPDKCLANWIRSISCRSDRTEA